jgi:Fe-S-cluster containining protein
VRAWRRRRGEPSFRLGGECRRCARCCEAPAIRANAAVWHLRTLRATFLWWQRAVNGFELREAQRAERTFVFRCTHFDEQTRSCDSYDTRPGMCRDYPRALLDQAAPELLPGCGYRPVSARAGRLLAVLEAQPLTEEQRARLRRDLHLE